MAVTATLKTSGVAGYNSGYSNTISATLTAQTFAAGSLVVVIVGGTKGENNATTDWLTVSGAGLTWTARASAGNSNQYRAAARVFTAPDTAGGSRQITVGSGGIGAVGVWYAVYEVTGHDPANPVAATAARTGTETDGALSINLSAAPASTSLVLAGIALDTDPSPGVAPGAGWTEDADINAGGGNYGNMQFQRRTGSTSTSVAWADIRTGGAAYSNAAAAVELVEAPPSGAWLFDGVDDRFVVAADSAAMDFEPLTVCCWVWNESHPGGFDSRYVNKAAGSASGYFNFTDRTNLIRFRVGGATANGGQELPLGVWNAMIGVYDPTSAEGWSTGAYTTNGGASLVLRTTASGTRHAYNSADITIGAQDDGGNPTHGYIYAVALFDRVLTAQERDDYVAGTMPANPRLLWLLDNNSVSQPSTGSFTNVAVATGPTWDAAKTLPVTYSTGPTTEPKTGTDSGSLSVTETTSIQKFISVSDFSNLSVTESSSIDVVYEEKASSESLTISVSESSNVGAEASTNIDFFVTQNDQSELLAGQPQISFQSSGVSNHPTTIEVQDSTEYYEIAGFGAAMTEAAATVISGLPTATRNAAMQALFDPINGAGLSFVRLTIGSSDYTVSNYTYADVKGPEGDELANFSIAREDTNGVVARMQQALSLNPGIKTMATPWSPPAWMRQNNTFYGDTGGPLLAQYYSTYAEYLVRYLEEMRVRGIDIDYISIQNEPQFAAPYMGMVMSAAEQIDFIKNHLASALEASVVETKILGWDHNFDQDSGTAGNQTDNVQTLLADAQIKSILEGIAWHGYVGNTGALDDINALHPGTAHFFTEITEFGVSNFSEDMRWIGREILMPFMAKGGRGFLEWNLALNTDGGPHTRASSDLRGLIVVDEVAETYTFQPAYYAIAHAAKYIKAGAKRVARSSSNPYNIIYTEAYKNPDGTIVLHVQNDGGTPQDTTLIWKGSKVNTSLATGLTTFTWQDPDAKYSQDAGTLSVSESASMEVVFDEKTGSDISAVSVSETSSILADLSVTSSDSASISVAETVALQKNIVAEDSSALSIVDSTDSIGVEVNAADTIGYSVIDDSSQNVSLEISDSATISCSESVEILTTLSTSDDSSLSVSDSGQVFFDRPGADTGSISVTESSSVVVSGVIDVNASDSLSLSGLDTSQLDSTLYLESSESNSLSVQESSSVEVGGVIDQSASDSGGLSVDDSSSVAITESIGGTDQGSISVTEDSSMVISGGNDVNSSDSPTLSIDESSSREISPVGTESTSLAITESSELFKTVVVDDSLGVSVGEVANTFTDYPGNDAGVVSVIESSSVLVSGVTNKSASETIGLEIIDLSDTELQITGTDVITLQAADLGTAEVTQNGWPTFVWDGSSWVPAEVYVWDGTQWVQKEIKIWNNTSWI